MNKAAANRIQIQLAKLGTHREAMFLRAAEVMASRPGYSVTGLVLTNKDGEFKIIDDNINATQPAPQT